MKKFSRSTVICISIVGILCLVLGIGSVVYAAGLFAVQSPIQGTIIVRPYGSNVGGPTPTPTYSATATQTAFYDTVAAGSNHIGTISTPTTVIVTDTSTSGHLTGIESISLNGTLQQGVGITINDTLPVLFDSNRSAVLHFTLIGYLPEGIYDLSTGNPIFTINCY